MSKDLNKNSQVIIYKDNNENIKVDVLLENETLWMNQKQIASLFDKARSTITEHINNIFAEGELKENSVCRNFRITAEDGKTYDVSFYNLELILAVGYRVKSKRGIAFRQWASDILKEYIVKGFAMNDERLKQPNYAFGQDYFDEQLERIREIRSSERRFYQKITDIYSQCSIDYDKTDEITQKFFATVQNKLHFAITGQTAAEIIHSRVDSKKANMGLTTWKNASKGKIRKRDVLVAKNYLNEDEIDTLNRIVSMYLDYAELQAKNKIPMKMNDWIEKLNAFLKFNEKDILENAGKISQEVAEKLAEEHFEQFKIEQDKTHESDFDKLVKESKKLSKKK
jgi:hypothetical protein